MAAKISDDFSCLTTKPIEIPTTRKGYSEGPIFFKRNGIYYYLYTINGHQNYGYGYMMSKESPLSGYYAPTGEDVILASSPENGVWGPGHGNIFYDQTQGKYIFVYLEFGEGSTTRQVFANELKFKEDGTICPIIPDFKGIGYLGNAQVKSKNIAIPNMVTVSSFRAPLTQTVPVETDWNNQDTTTTKMLYRTHTYNPENAIDQSNGTRWRSLAEDKQPWIVLDFGKRIKISECEMAFVAPTFGHAWRLERSDDGQTWELLDEQTLKLAKSPHRSLKRIKTRYLRLTITEGEGGLWEFKVHK